MKGMLKSVWKCTEGSVAPTVALSLVALVAAGGIAFDYAHLASLDTELQQAADQAALAAATQLDGSTNSRTRATAAAQSLLSNKTRFANDNNASGTAVTIANVYFYSTVADAEADTNRVTTDSGAKFVRVAVNTRKANYALTPIVGAMNSGDLGAEAVAGMKGAICRVPPMMLCNPKPGTPFDADAWKGVGVMATGHGNDNSGKNSTNSAWAPGDFGFLSVTTAANTKAQNEDLLKALAIQDLSIECLQQNSGEVTTGNPQGAYDAINTRFDIYDFNGGSATSWKACAAAGTCPAAKNVTKDLVNEASVKNCGFATGASGKGWQLPALLKQFWPRKYNAADTSTTAIHDTSRSSAPDAMGLPRDNCHYDSYLRACSSVNGSGGTSNKFGDGKWARADYFKKYHDLDRPSGWESYTRYQTYAWELKSSKIPKDTTGSLRQYGSPVCSVGTPAAGTDRRVLSVAIVENCSSLSGSSTNIVVGQWADVFLVEPTIDGRGNGATKDSIYVEIIGKTTTAGTSSQNALTIDRRVPYLVK